MMRSKGLFVATVSLVGVFLLSDVQARIYYDSPRSTPNYNNYQNYQYENEASSPRSYPKKAKSKRVYGMPSKITPTGKTVFIYSPAMLTWGAYDAQGDLVRTGPGSGGKGYCPDIHRSCRTPSGVYSIYSKQGPGYRSKKFPVGKGGAPMPYAMFFRGGYAIHGSNYVPGYNASHGCIRVLPSDARWLSQNFLSYGSTVIVRSY